MKKFIFLISAFIATIILLDIGFGLCMDALRKIESGPNYHCCELADEDILVLGSSLAQQDIIPKVIEEQSSLKVFNAGESGNGVICAYARFKLFSTKHKPLMIIYVLTPKYDYLHTEDIEKYLSSIKTYYWKEEVRDIFRDCNSYFSDIKYLSNFYRYNSEWSQILRKSLSPSKNKDGYRANTNIYKPDSKVSYEKEYQAPIDNLLASYLDRLFKEIKDANIDCYCVIPPSYFKKEECLFEKGKELARKYDIKIIDCNYMENFSGNPMLFSDSEHLNDLGAKEFSRSLMNEYIKKSDE